MKNRTILTMILAVTIVSGLFTGCGAKETTTKVASATTKVDKISDNTDKKKEEIVTDFLNINVSADKGWDADSTPAILHIDSKDDESVDFYHAISPDAEGGKGNTTVTLAEGTYTVEFVSPLNHDGSAYEIFDMGAEQEITVEFGKDMAIDCEMKQIPADQVTDEMIADIVNKTQTAITKGDDTLKGDKVKDMLDNLAQNVQNSPNASDETKELAGVVADTTEIPEETKTDDVKAENNVQDNSQNNAANGNVNNNVQDNAVNNNQNNAANNNQNNAANNNNQTATQPSVPVQTPAQTPSAPVVSEPQAPAHTHTWADHVVTTQEWVANMVTVPDYEEQTTYVWVCACGAVMPSGTEDDHMMNHLLNGEESLAHGYVDSQTTTVQVGSHTEDQGHYETKNTVDYRYCTGCGEKQ